MKRRPSHSALECASRALETAVEEARLAGRVRLPTIDRLARRAGVSRMTMWRAVRDARKAGRLTARRRRGIELDTGAPRTVDPPPPVPADRRAYSVLAKVLDTGEICPGDTLAPQKVLRQQCATGHRAVRRALRRLEAEGRIRRRARSYVVARHTAHVPANTVVLFKRGESATRPQTASERNEELHRQIEEAFAEHGIRLRTELIYYEGRRLVAADGGPPGRLVSAERSSPLGYVYWTSGLEDLDPPAFCAALAGRGRPVAVIDEQGAFALPPLTARRSRICCFPLGTDDACARRAGRILLERGHERMAYVGPRRPGDARLAGLAQTHAEAGLEQGVVECTYLPAPQAVPNEAARLFRQFHARALSKARSKTARLLITAAGRCYWNAIRPALTLELAADALASPLEEVLARGDVTALVGYNDTVALACLSHLQRTGMRVPRDISLVGLDDGRSAQYHDITCYNHNVRGIARAILAHILRPPLPLRKRPASIAVEGYLAERGTLRSV